MEDRPIKYVYRELLKCRKRLISIDGKRYICRAYWDVEHSALELGLLKAYRDIDIVYLKYGIFEVVDERTL